MGERESPAISMPSSAALSALTTPVSRMASAKGAPGDVFHGDEIRVVAATPVVDADDVGMGEVGRRLGLAAETLDEGGVGGVFGEQDLDRDQSVEEQVTGQVDVGHPTTSDPLLLFVTVAQNGGAGLGHR